MFRLLQDGLVRVLAADPKLMELAYGRVIFESYGAYAADPMSIAAMLDRAIADMQDRAARFAGRQRGHTPTIEDPFTVVLVDEVAFLTAYQPDRKLKERIMNALATFDHPGPRGRLLRGGRVAGPAQGRADDPEPVPGPDRHAAGRT
jgi:S-DNA-T family DNA segregation ATPase FtsK/SpoIIIE